MEQQKPLTALEITVQTEAPVLFGTFAKASGGIGGNGGGNVNTPTTCTSRNCGGPGGTGTTSGGSGGRGAEYGGPDYDAVAGESGAGFAPGGGGEELMMEEVELQQEVLVLLQSIKPSLPVLQVLMAPAQLLAGMAVMYLLMLRMEEEEVGVADILRQTE